MKKHAFYRILILFLICSGNLFAEETVSLVPNLQVGDQWKMKLSMHLKDFDSKRFFNKVLDPIKKANYLGFDEKFLIQSNWQMECLT